MALRLGMILLLLGGFLLGRESAPPVVTPYGVCVCSAAENPVGEQHNIISWTTTYDGEK